jgi:phage-related protein
VKPWKGEGPGVFEVVEFHDGNTYRTIYTVRFRQAIFMHSRRSRHVGLRLLDLISRLSEGG